MSAQERTGRGGRLDSLIPETIRDTTFRLSGLFKAPGAPGYNAMAEKSPSEWGPKTRAALIWATSTPEGRGLLRRVFERWPAASKFVPDSLREGL